MQDGVIGGGTASGAVTEGLIAANRHGGMAEVLETAFAALEAAGTGVVGRRQPFMYFAGPFATSSKYGSWGQMGCDQPGDESLSTAPSVSKSAGTQAPGTPPRSLPAASPRTSWVAPPPFTTYSMAREGGCSDSAARRR